MILGGIAQYLKTAFWKIAFKKFEVIWITPHFCKKIVTSFYDSSFYSLILSLSPKL